MNSSFSGASLKFTTLNTERFRVASTGNLLIGTTTDAGFKLDVNGTARVQGDLRITKSTFSSLLAFNSGTFGSAPEYFDLAYPINGGLRYVPNLGTSFDGATFQCFGGTATSFAGQMYFDYGSQARNISARSANWRNASLAGVINVLTLTANSNVLINTTTDVASSKLTIESTTQGFLPPRMTTTQKKAIASPVAGLMVYDTTLNLMALYNGTTWITL
jgi:hypothetical protein